MLTCVQTIGRSRATEGINDARYRDDTLVDVNIAAGYLVPFAQGHPAKVHHEGDNGSQKCEAKHQEHDNHPDVAPFVFVLQICLYHKRFLECN